MIAELKPLLVIAQEEIQSLRAKTVRLRKERDGWKQEVADWRASADRLRDDRDRLRAELAACAAGAWHDGSEKPPGPGLYLIATRDEFLQVRFFYGDVWGKGKAVSGWSGPIRIGDR